MEVWKIFTLLGLTLTLAATQAIGTIVETVRPEAPIQPLEAPPVVESNVLEYDEADENIDEFPLVEDPDDIYASEFPYGEPLENFTGAEDRSGRISSRQGRAHIRIVHKYAGKPRNYAKKYRTWMPSKEWVRPIKSKKAPKRLAAHPSKRKPGRRREGRPPNRRKKIRPTRGSNLRKPAPPPEPDYEYFSEEEYFPEENKRQEFGHNERRPPHKKQGMRRKPGYKMSGERYQQSEDYPSVSYSNFVQHPASTASSYDYPDFIDDEPHQSHSHKKERRKKKKRRKGDRKNAYDRNEDQFGANSESVEEANGHNNYDKYPPYLEDPPLKRPIRHPQPTQQSPVYGEGYIGQTNRIAQNKNRGGDSTGLGRFRNDVSSLGVQTFGGSQPYEQNNFNNFGVSNNRPQSDIITQQNYNQFANQDYTNNNQGFSNNNQAYTNNNEFTTAPQRSQNFGTQENFNRQVNYNQNYANRPVIPQQITNAHTLQNVIPNSRGNEYSSKYKSSSFFDNTESFQDFNQNVNYNQQNNVGSAQRPVKFVPSTQYEEPADAENDFINRHLDLYSNGMTGVPTQGDGRQEHRPKDYDIGYGEIQYDETHRTK